MSARRFSAVALGGGPARARVRRVLRLGLRASLRTRGGRSERLPRAVGESARGQKVTGAARKAPGERRGATNRVPPGLYALEGNNRL